MKSNLRLCVIVTVAISIACSFAAQPAPGSEQQSKSPSDRVAILIKSTPYRLLKKEIEQYKSDVEKRFPVKIHIVTNDWQKPEEVRSSIKDLNKKENTTGVVLVGAIPMHRFHMHDFDNPNPLYYEDFDLQFTDKDGNGIPESYVGTPKLKVWVANLRGVEDENDDGIEVLRTFFNKTHAYYTGKQKVERRALAVTDSDWPEGATLFRDNVGGKLFGKKNVDVLSCKEATAKSIYEVFSKHSYTMFYVQLHSTPTRQDTSQGSLFSKDIIEINTGALITINHGCSNCNWMKNQTVEKGRNTGMSWVFGKGVGQAVVGNVRTGMVYGQETLYQRILADDYLGKAYFALKQSAEDEMHGAYPSGDTVAGVLFIGNPFLYMKSRE